MEAELSELLLRRLKPLNILRQLMWGGSCMGLFCYILIVYAFPKENDAVNDSAVSIIAAVFGVLSMFLMAAAMVMRGQFFSVSSVVRYLSGQPGWLFRIFAASRQRPPSVDPQLTPFDQRLYDFSVLSLVPQLFTWGLIDTIAVFGVICTLLLKNPLCVYPFVILAGAGMLLLFPNLKAQLSRGLYRYQTGMTD